MTWRPGGRPAVAVATGAVLMGGFLAVAYAGDLPVPAQRLAQSTIDAPAARPDPDPAASSRPAGPPNPAGQPARPPALVGRTAGYTAVSRPARRAGLGPPAPHRAAHLAIRVAVVGPSGFGPSGFGAGWTRALAARASPGRGGSPGPVPTPWPSPSASISPPAGATPSPSAAPSPSQSGRA